MFKLPESTQQLVKYHGDPTYFPELENQLPDSPECEGDDIFEVCFLASYKNVCNSLKRVPQVVEKG